MSGLSWLGCCVRGRNADGLALCREPLRASFKGILYTLLTRMQTSKTGQFVYYFVYYLTFCLAINVNGLTPDYIVGEFESIQPG